MHMTPYEVAWFCNHEYGETTWIIEDKDCIYLYTLYSKWLIKKDDFKRFGRYTLYHFNSIEREGYHVQRQGYDLDFLVYNAIIHDIPKEKRIEFSDFKHKWDMYQYGQQLWESIQCFNFLSGNDLRH